MQPEDIDKLFRQRLQGHAPTPPTDLWSRLEAELEPESKTRPLLWVYSMAAAIALLLVVGAGWLLRSRQLPATGAHAPLAAAQRPVPSPAARAHAAAANRQGANQQPGSTQKVFAEKTLAQATAGSATASNTPAARPATNQLAAATATSHKAATLARSPRPAVASHGSSTNSASWPAGQQGVASTQPAAQPERSQGSAAPAPTGAALVASAATPASTAVPGGTIEVEVRRKAEAPRALAAAPTRAPRLGGILRQVRNAVRGDEVSLADAGLPQTLTVQARVAGRTLSKTIEL